MSRKQIDDSQAWLYTLSPVTAEARQKAKEFEDLLTKSIERRNAMTEEARAAEDKSIQDARDQADWDRAVNSGLFRMRLAAEGFDFLSH